MTTSDEPNDNKGSGDQTTINSDGGDVAGRDIDKRQGKVFVEGDVYGNVIGEQVVHLPPLPPALHQLRAPVNDFVGREHEVDQLVQALRKAASGGTAAAISAVRGMGRIGKTELAYVVAIRLKDTFPDAQLVVALRGASSNPLTPEQALQTVIRSFASEMKLPENTSELQGIYRSLLTGKRLLILADDAFPDVRFTTQAYGPINLIAWWEVGDAKPLFLVTNAELCEEACAWYKRRFGIETLFGDHKSRGFQLHKSHLSDPPGLVRLLIATALAYVWMAYLGTAAHLEGWARVIHRTDRCDLSLFQLGLRLLEHFLDRARVRKHQMTKLSLSELWLRYVNNLMNERSQRLGQRDVRCLKSSPSLLRSRRLWM